MLTEHQSGGKTVWVDIYNPTNEEIAQACTDYRLDIPPRTQLEEIEFSSRLQYEDDVFTISVPVTPHNKNGGDDVTTPLGFVLSKELLVTVHFAQLHTFDRFGLTHQPALLLGMDVLSLCQKVTVDLRRREATFTLN